MNELQCAFAADGLSIDGRKLRGVALPYDTVGYPTDGVPTIIRVGAFAPIGDVVANVQHDKSRMIARTGDGDAATMTLTDTDKALMFAADLPETREADDVLALVKAGVLRGLSIEATPIKAAMVRNIRTVTRATLTGLAVVARPGFKDAAVKVAAGLSSDTRQHGTARLSAPLPGAWA